MIYFVSVPGNYIVRLIFSFDLEAGGTYQNDNYVFEEQMDDIFQESGSFLSDILKMSKMKNVHWVVEILVLTWS